MNIWKISLRNFQHKPLYTFLSILILAVSIGLLLGIQELDATFKYQMDNNLGDIDVVVGAKGSPLQLVLASVLHVDNPTGNIPYAEALKLKHNPMIKRAVPISYGDNYKGYRIVGTTDGFGEIYHAELAEGRKVEKSMEVVLGSDIAKRFHIAIGDTFLSSHGLVAGSTDVHHDPLTVVGIYKPTHKVLDRLIVTDLETVWDVHDHHHHDEEAAAPGEEAQHDEHAEEEEHEHEEAEAPKEVTSVLVTFRNPVALLTFPRNINDNTNMQAALPKYELQRLYQFTGIGVETISWIAYIILAISCITIFISLYRMVRERAFDLALLRTYGGNTFQLVRMVAYEGILIALIAVVLGVLLSQLGLYFIFEMVSEQYKQSMPQKFPIAELTETGLLVALMILLSIVLAIRPILKMNISKIISHEK